jgi:mannose-6-phosphate isomerase-like protein (cupin superfamily)
MQFPSDTSKESVFADISQWLKNQGFNVANKDDSRPWGGFFVIDESQAPTFISTFFPHLSLSDFEGFSKLSPKILLVAPGKRLSWQYHHRRSEIWKVVGGNAAIVISDTDEETPVQQLPLGTVVSLRQGERHRLVGADEWGVIAEIWQHTDPANPSDEDDIVRVQDDFGR